MACLISERNLVHVVKTDLLGNKKSISDCNFLYRSSKAGVFIFHFNIKKAEKITKKRKREKKKERLKEGAMA